MEVGRAYNLTCWVLSVAPVKHLTVTLRQGGWTLHTETFQHHTGAEPSNITVTQEITPLRWDHGQQVSCHADLDLTLHGPLIQKSSSAMELQVYGAVQGSFEVHVSPEAPVVEHGGSVWINCSHTCEDPAAPGGLETSLAKASSKHGPSWVAFHLVNIQEWASAPVCHFVCRGDSRRATAALSAYRAPEQVVLEPLPVMEVGRAYNLTCWVLSVAPVKHLTVTLRQGGWTLHTETFQHHTGAEPSNITVTQEITPLRWDHGQQVSCHADLDLTLHGPLIQKSSSAMELQVYGAVQGSFEVHVSPEAPLVEHGGSVWINCSHTCEDPAAPGGLETSLAKASSKHGPSWVAFHLVNIQEWASAPVCHFVCRGDSRRATAALSAYRAPEQVVLEPLPVMEVGRAYNLTCWVLSVAPVKHLTVTLRQGGWTLHTETFQHHTGAEPSNITVTQEITPLRWDHGQQVSCHADLDLTLHGPLIQKSSSAMELQVYDGPRMDDSSCPRNRTWEVGTEQTFSCVALGNPPPAVVCAKDGVPFRGTYHCKASNAHGTASREVTVQVKDKFL
nr:intercellular adhesion molecule 5-like [Pelodiscus sinensis]|eukprot:XP_025035881.1 intercellular adhesion molecule 5-like [Pelodiscus sinensis]